MILVIQKWILENEHFNEEEKKSEIYRLINVIYNGAHAEVVCERLEDERPAKGHKVKKFKGDLETFELDRLRVVHNTDTQEDEYERYRNLQELSILIKGK